MQVILRDNVNHLGRRGEIVKVSDGYARNFLIPRKLAYRVTDGVERQIEVESRAKEKRDARLRANADAVAARLNDVGVLRFERRAGETGALFGSVTNVEIAEELSGKGIDIDRRDIRLDEPIKSAGTHRVMVHLLQDLNVELVVEVEPVS